MKTTVGKCLMLIGHPDVYMLAEQPIVSIVISRAKTVALRKRGRELLSLINGIVEDYEAIRQSIVEEFQEKDADGQPIRSEENPDAFKMRSGWQKQLEERINEEIEVEFTPFAEDELGDGFTLAETLRLGDFCT